MPIRFSEPIDPSTLSIRVWSQDARDKEGAFISGVKPLVESCSGGKTCGDLKVDWVKDDSDTVGIDLTFNEDGLGEAGRPLLVEIREGLEDEVGTDTGIPYLFDLQFRLPPDRVNDKPVTFDNGVFLLAGAVNEPLPVVLRMICEMKVVESGEMALTCAEANQIEGAERTSKNPEEQIINDTSIGFTVYTTGFVKINDDDSRLLQSDPFNISVPLGPLSLKMDGVRISGEVIKDGIGKDGVNGSLSYESLSLIRGKKENKYDASSAPLEMIFIPEDKRGTLEGRPELCGDLCGKVVGQCMPPDMFPPTEFCDGGS